MLAIYCGLSYHPMCAIENCGEVLIQLLVIMHEKPTVITSYRTIERITTTCKLFRNAAVLAPLPNGFEFLLSRPTLSRKSRNVSQLWFFNTSRLPPLIVINKTLSSLCSWIRLRSHPGRTRTRAAY